MEESSYKISGVDIDAGNNAVDKIKPFVQKTFRKEVLTGLGGFSGLFQLDMGRYKNPVLVSGTDGVGTKLKVAIELGIHDTVGIDLVAMVVNDLLTSGAEPLFFLDYIATGKLEPQKITEIVKGICTGCEQAKMALIGGETAEMPGMYSQSDYDLAGFGVGVVERDKIIDGSTIQEGDLLYGLPSSGFHSNGYSLIRHILFNKHQMAVNEYIDELKCSLKDILLKPTTIYVSIIQKLKELINIKGLSHITGGGLYENTMRIIPGGLDIELNQWDVPKEFLWLQKLGSVSDSEMRRVFNMGIGMVLVIPPSDADLLKQQCKDIIWVGKVFKK